MMTVDQRPVHRLHCQWCFKWACRADQTWYLKTASYFSVWRKIIKKALSLWNGTLELLKHMWTDLKISKDKHVLNHTITKAKVPHPYVIACQLGFSKITDLQLPFWRSWKLQLFTALSKFNIDIPNSGTLETSLFSERRTMKARQLKVLLKAFMFISTLNVCCRLSKSEEK